VKAAGFLLFLLLLVPVVSTPGRAEPFTSGQALDQGLVISVTATALAFMAPRTLEAVPIPRLALWGLRSLTTLDARLSVELKDGALRLSLSTRLLLARKPPAEADADGWGRAIADMVRAGWDASEAVRHAGTNGITGAFFDELFNHLDPYSRYVSPAEAALDRDRRAGRGGIGAAIGLLRGGFVVQDVIDDGPAANAGVRIGDRLLEVDGNPTQDTDLTAVNRMLAGPSGTAVRLTLRGRDGRRRSVDITRAIIVPETVLAERVQDALVLHITAFSSDTGARLGAAIVHGLAGPRPPRGLVLDLRGNRGGLLREAVSAAETLLSEGVVSTSAGRDPQAAHEFRASGQDLSRGAPIVVLVDGRSASAAEVLAAALADQRRAVVVGSATLGKGLVQTIAPLPDGGTLYLTWSRVLAPLGWPIQGLGVLPQVCTSFGEAATRRQLQELVQGQQPMADALIRHRASRAPLPPAEILQIRSVCPAAEGRDIDLPTARFLIDNPGAYATALLPVLPPRMAVPPPERPQSGPPSLTSRPEVRN
jgi:carboxyl-terminal processing protease